MVKLTEQQIETIRAVADRITDDNFAQHTYGPRINHGSAPVCGTAYCVAGHTIEHLSEQGDVRIPLDTSEQILLARDALGIGRSLTLFDNPPPIVRRTKEDNPWDSSLVGCWRPPTAEEMVAFLRRSAVLGRWPKEIR